MNVKVISTFNEASCVEISKIGKQLTSLIKGSTFVSFSNVRSCALADSLKAASREATAIFADENSLILTSNQ